MQVDFLDAKPLPSTRYWAGHHSHAPKWIVLHGTAGGSSAEAIATWLNTQTETDPTSVHYVVGQNGEVVQLVSEADAAWGNGVLSNGHEPFWDQVAPEGNPNWVTFSIEHVKSHSDNSDHLTPAQQSASFRLIADLCRRHNIPAQKATASGGIATHASIDPLNRAGCPGPYPFDALIAYLTGGTGQSSAGDEMTFPAGIPAGWRDENAILYAPNNQPVARGFRATVLAGWDPDNWPLGAEFAQTPANPLDAHGSAGTTQFFKRTVLVWQSADNRIFPLDAGSLANYYRSLTQNTSSSVTSETKKRKTLETAVQQAETELAAAVKTAEA